MRYAVYIGRADEPVQFSSSYATYEQALEQVAMIKATTLTQRGVIIPVHHPDQMVDPMAKDLWPTITPSEANKLARDRIREKH